MLEELEHAKQRGAQIYGEVPGYGSTADAYRITDTHPEGRGAIALHASWRWKTPGSTPTTSTTSTPTAPAPRSTTRSRRWPSRTVFGEQAYKMPVSSTKSMMGHLIAAAGATELIVCLMAIRDSVLPPTINYETPDPDCDLDYIPNHAREARCDHALSNSFGFGGQEIALIVGGRCRERASVPFRVCRKRRLPARSASGPCL